MTEDLAIRAGKKLPNTHEEMAIVSCEHVDCPVTFLIIHHSAYKDMARARRQVAHIKGIMRDEHIRATFKDHFQVYDLEDVD